MTELNHYHQVVGAPVPEWQGARPLSRAALVGRYCRLEPLDAQSHSQQLFEAYQLAPDERDWTWLASSRPDTPQAAWHWVQGKAADPTLVPYAVVEQKRGEAVGLVCFMRIDTGNGTVEIGHVTWSPRMKNSVLGTEAVWLLLSAAFEQGYRRVEWKCDSLNTASHNAALRLGFTFEGRLRQMMVRKGRNRDSEWFSIIDGEWPQRNAALSRWLAPENFDAQGRQKQPLSAFHAR